nr:SDR family NAD(P)-dependent oxidoreductase [Glaciecola punicea]
MSSILGVSSIGKLNAYCASKFAVRCLTELLQMEALADFPYVIVCVVHSGGINTAIANNAIHFDGRNENIRQQEMKTFKKQPTMTPIKTANIIVNGILNDKTRILIELDAKLMDWIVRIFPAKYSILVLKQIKKRGL